MNYHKSPQIKQSRLKQALLEERLSRQINTRIKKIKELTGPVSKKIGAGFKDQYFKLQKLEEKYRHKILKSSFQDKVNKNQFINQLVEEGYAFLQQENYEEAEKKFLDALQLDEKHLGAYKGLGQLYLEQKDYEHAREIFEFVLSLSETDPLAYRSLGEIDSQKGDLKGAEEKLNKSLELDAGDIQSYLDLAEIYLNLDEPVKAFEIVQRAVAKEPNNPRALDFLIEVSIIVRDKEAALKNYNLLKEVNPDNNKLESFKERIENI